MELIKTIKQTLYGTDDQNQTYRFHCRGCETIFERPVEDVAEVTCPECQTTEREHLFRL